MHRLERGGVFRNEPCKGRNIEKAAVIDLGGGKAPPGKGIVLALEQQMQLAY
jgi:hypothetical protein